MINETQSKATREAKWLRQQAAALLTRLIADREQSEKRFAEAGKRDPMKSITGQTALENAIASTKEMISNMDALVVQMESQMDIDAAAAVEFVPTLRSNGYSNGKNGFRTSKAVALTGTP